MKKEELPKLDQLREKENLPKSKKKKKTHLILKVFIVIFVIFAAFASIFSYKIAATGKKTLSQNKDSSFISQIKGLIGGDKELRGEADLQTNILLLGMGGEGHEGALLTDTIIIVMIKHVPDSEEKKVALLSIPRDLYYCIEPSNCSKINSLYAREETESKKNNTINDATYINNAISDITGLEMHYYVRADFEAFEQIVDILNGVEVDIENSFYDKEYPTVNYGYQTISFEKGLNTLNGDEALKYARSRHGVVTDGDSEEGSDFARAKRQQKILVGIRDKALSLGTLANPVKINDILNTLGDHLRSNLEIWELVKLFEISKSVDKNKIINKVIDPDSSLLYPTRSNTGSYILLPYNKDFAGIRNFCSNIFSMDIISGEEAKIAILNGTNTNSLANSAKKYLESNNLNIKYTGNAPKNDYKNTIIYDYSNGSKPETLKYLKEQYNATTTPNPPAYEDFLIPLSKLEEEETIDIILILGFDYPK